jgi:hypothetical protein
MTHAHRIEAPNVTPLMVTPANCEQVLGVKYRWCKERARELGVPVIRIGGKSLIEAAPLVEALKREAASKQPAPLIDEEQRSQMRAQLGLVRR